MVCRCPRLQSSNATYVQICSGSWPTPTRSSSVQGWNLAARESGRIEDAGWPQKPTTVFFPRRFLSMGPNNNSNKQCFWYNITRHVQITPLLCSLHWLRVPERIEFRLMMLVTVAFMAWHPSTCQLIWCVSPMSALGSDFALRRLRRWLVVVSIAPPLATVLTAAAPAVWNSLSEEVRSSTSLPVFWRRLKLELFKRSFIPS